MALPPNRPYDTRSSRATAPPHAETVEMTRASHGPNKGLKRAATVAICIWICLFVTMAGLLAGLVLLIRLVLGGAASY